MTEIRLSWLCILFFPFYNSWQVFLEFTKFDFHLLLIDKFVSTNTE